MNKCKICKKTISDGSEYCNECLGKMGIITDESYLDNLLNSVLEESITARDIYDKKSGRGKDSDHEVKVSDSVELNDIIDFENLDISEDLEEPVDIDIEDINGAQKDFDIDYADTDADNTEDKKLDSDTVEDIETGPDTATFDAADDTVNASDNTEIADTDNVDITDTAADNLYNNIDTEFLETDYPDEYSEYEEEIADSSLDDLLKQFDVSSDDVSSGEMEPDNDMSGENVSGMNAYSEDKEKKGTDEVLMDGNITPEDELLRLLNQFNPDDPITDDIQSITELLGGLVQELQDGNYADFTDTASSNISVEVKEREEEPDNGIKYITPEDDEEVKSPRKEKKKSKKAKKKDEAKEGIGILQRLFGNVKDEEAASDLFTASDSTADPDKEKKKKKRKGKKEASNEEADGDEVATASRRDSDETENYKKVKKAKKEKKKKEKVTVIEEEIDEGRINRAGASIVFAFFAVLVILLLVTTNAFTYKQNIKNASKYFERKEYAQAYNEIYGLDLKDKDVELYNKIKTVMIVNKQLESYYNYYDMRMFPEALDSLLKGLKRYEKYIELATMLGIKEDLDYIRDRIVEELYYVFSMSEEEAMEILNIESQPDYTKAVYDAVHDIITYY